jgi:hypothetical protein
VDLLQLKFNSPLHDAEGSQTSLLQNAAASKIFPLHFATERCDSLLHLALESQILLLQNAAESQILPPYDAAGSQILPLDDAAGSQILPLHDAAGSQFGSGESSLKSLEDSLGP